MKRNFCLPAKQVAHIVKDILSGKLTSEDISGEGVSSQARKKILEKYVGALAPQVNTVIEHKIASSNAETAVIDFIREQTGLNEKRKAFFEKKYKERIEKLFEPKNETAFLEDAVEDILGVSVTLEEAQVLKKLTDEAVRAKEEAKNVRIKDIRDMYKEIASVDTSKMPAHHAEAVANLQAKLNEIQVEDVEKETQEKITRLQKRIVDIETGVSHRPKEKEVKITDPRIQKLETQIKNLLAEQRREPQVHKRLVEIDKKIEEIKFGALKRNDIKLKKVEDPRVTEKRRELDSLKKEKKDSQATARKILKLQDEIADLTINGLKDKSGVIKKIEKSPEVVKLKIEKQELRDSLKKEKNTQSKIDRLLKRKETILSGVPGEVTHRPIETTEEVIQLKEEIKLLKAQDYSGRYRKLIGSLLGEGNIPLEIEMLIKQTASTKEKLQYATAIQNLNNYMEAAKTDVNFSKFQSADAFVEYLQKRHIYVVPDFVFGFLDPAMRAFRATMDISFGGAQGAFASVTNPKITLKNFTKALAGGLRQSKKSFTGKAKDNTELDAVMIDFFSRDRFIDGTYDKAGFDITKTKYDTYGKLDMQDIPVVGQFTSRVFKPFDVAFEIFMARQKLDIFDALIADTKGDLSKEELQDYNRIASSIAMRVSPKQLGGAAEVASAVLWSASLMVSSWNLLTAHSLGLGLKTPQARRVAYRKSLMAMGFYVGIITTLAQATDEDDDWYVVGDPTSSDFGKLIIGDRRITLLPILSGYIVLFSRMISGRYTNTKGKTISLGGIYDTGIHDAIFENSELPLGKYGGTQNVGQVAGRFVQYKFSPLVTAGLTTLGIKTGFEDDPEDFSYEARLLRSVSPLSTVAVYDNFQSEESQSLQTYMSILEVLGKYNTEYK